MLHSSYESEGFCFVLLSLSKMIVSEQDIFCKSWFISVLSLFSLGDFAIVLNKITNLGRFWTLTSVSLTLCVFLWLLTSPRSRSLAFCLLLSARILEVWLLSGGNLGAVYFLDERWYEHLRFHSLYDFILTFCLPWWPKIPASFLVKGASSTAKILLFSRAVKVQCLNWKGQVRVACSCILLFSHRSPVLKS